MIIEVIIFEAVQIKVLFSVPFLKVSSETL